VIWGGEVSACHVGRREGRGRGIEATVSITPDSGNGILRRPLRPLPSTL